MGLSTRDVPYPGTWTVREARDAYLAENGFTVAAYDDAWTKASAFGVAFKIPNTERHRSAIRLHDLHHVATGFGTDLVGEGEISAFEVRRGLPRAGLYVASIVVMVTLTGFVLSPARVLAAFEGAKRTTPLWALDIPYEDLLDMTVAELRALLQLPEDGLAKHPRRLHDQAPANAQTA
ncbi:MAG TPA: hypothetical protein VM925_09490 [Labilithrix sp.]|jgi:hypothetical protein|nr:hypothetical protein [Labilithrix sp.]